MSEISISENRQSSRPQEGRSKYIQDTVDGLESHEFNRINKLIEEHYDKKKKTIMEKSLGEVMNNTANFFNNSFYSFSDKILEAEAILRLDDDNYSFTSIIKKYITAMILFIRDDENIIYMGIIMIILSILICFFNISRGNGFSEPIKES